MSKDLAVLVIHGIGSQQPGFSRPMWDELEHRISGLGHDPDRIAWREIYWADILHPRQEQYLRDANAGNKLDYVRLRRFV
ncbi:MAG: hypothetical protein KY476_24280, partial [Planctomycetes bacterium]|nr:hypothetical protein [Planctomycetota bacterium]